MRQLSTVDELRAAVAEARAAGSAHVGLVPTMGNLHDGHIALVREGRERADYLVVSVFVNPLQFGEGEDYARYPRTLERDLGLLAEEGVDLVFAPSEKEMYPYGQSATRVVVRGLSDILCGAYRPGHFEGVTTVVSMLLNQVRPDVAVFGEKDYQQLVLIRRMVADLHQPTEIVGTATVREPDGLALSSRNQYLTDGQRARAPQLYAALQSVARRLAGGERDFSALAAAGRAQLEAAGLRPDYFEIRDPDLLPPTADGRHWVVLAAAWLGEARLIDNVRVDI